MTNSGGPPGRDLQAGRNPASVPVAGSASADPTGRSRTGLITLRTLGAVELLRLETGGRIPVPAQPKRLAILAYLAVSPGTPHRRDVLLGLLWPEFDTMRARRALSQALYGLRQGLGRDVVESHGNEEVRARPEAVWCDVVEFARRLEAGEFEHALELHRGDFLPGLHVAGAPEFERWLVRMRRHYDTAAEEAALRLADESERAGDARRAVDWLQRVLEISPADEATFRRFVTGLEAAGERAGAIHAFEAFARRLRDEYDLQPSQETLRLVEAMRRRAPQRAPTGSPARGRRDPVESGIERLAAGGLRSIAVLPLRNLTATDGEHYLADGISEALTMELGRIGGLRVISYQSVMRFRGSQRPLDAIAADLQVEAVLQGSVAREANRVRIAVQLSRVEPEAVLWAGSYQRELGALAWIYDDVARSVCAAVRVALAPAQGARPRRDRTDPETYEAYLKGRYFSFVLSDVERGIAYFRRAIDRDPTFAPAYAGLASLYANLTLFLQLPPERSRSRLEAAVGRALELDDSLVEAHVARALGHCLFDYDWPAALRAFRTAVELGPSSSLARAYYAAFLTAMGWSRQGLEQAETAARLDPLDAPVNWLLGWARLKASRFGPAVETLEGVLELHPHFALALPFLAEAHLHGGDTGAARSRAIQAVEAAPENQLVLGRSAAVLALTGARAEAEHARGSLDALRRDRYVDPYYPAVASSALDDPEKAVARWEAAIAGRTASAYCLRADALTHSLRDHPRFQALLHRLNFPDPTAAPLSLAS